MKEELEDRQEDLFWNGEYGSLMQGRLEAGRVLFQDNTRQIAGVVDCGYSAVEIESHYLKGEYEPGFIFDKELFCNASSYVVEGSELIHIDHI